MAVFAIAWVSLVASGRPSTAAVVTTTLATLLAVCGTWLSTSASASRRETGWRLQAGAVALLAAAALAAAAAAPGGA